MKTKIIPIGLMIMFSASCAEAKPGGAYTLTGEEKGVSEIIIADMEEFPELYNGETLSGYVAKFKRENRIGKRKLSAGDKLRFPETLASIKARKSAIEEKRKQEEKHEPERTSQKISGRISDVGSKKATNTTKKRGTYKAQTFEYTYGIGPCKLVEIKSFFEFKNSRNH